MGKVRKAFWLDPRLLVEDEGLVLRDVRRSFVFDILIARSCREVGVTLVSRNATDLARIANVFSFEFASPYPTGSTR